MNDMPYALPIPYRDPLGAFAAFAGESNVAFLDSAAENGGRGRYAYIAADPFRVITAAKGGTTVDGCPAAGDPFQVLERQRG